MTNTGHVPGTTTVRATVVSLVCALGDASAHVPDLTRPDQTCGRSLQRLFVHSSPTVTREVVAL